MHGRPDHIRRPIRARAERSLAAFLVLALAGCGDVDTGVVELAWVFVDRDGEPIFPAGQFAVGNRDSCGLPGRIDGDPVSYDLEVEVEICDPACPDGCGAEACRVIPPLRFSCETARGSDPDVPSSDDPYLFTFRSLVFIDGPDVVCPNPEPTCIAVPGPRERIVRPGLVTDLQVVQIVVDVDQSAPTIAGGALDLEACGCA